MIGMRDLASHIIAVANERGIGISNLQLQKIMFFIFGRMASDPRNEKFLSNMYDLKFRRWSYGPVVEEIYFDYNNFGGRPIVEENASTNSAFDAHDDNIVQLLALNPFQLVEATHRLPSWADYKEDIESRDYVPPYEINDFVREFRRDVQ